MTLLRCRLALVWPGFLSVVLLVACSKPSPTELVAAARRHIDEGNHAAAQIELRNAIQQAPNHGHAQRLLGVTLLRLGDPVGAEIALRKSLTLDEKADDVWPTLAQAVLKQGQAQKVIDEFGAVTVADRSAAGSIKAAVGQAWLQRGQIPAAIAAFAAAIEMHSENASALLGQGRIAAHEGKVDDAMAAVEKALKVDERFAEAHVFKSQLSMAKGDHSSAVESLEKAIAIDSGYLAARLALAAALIDGQAYDRAKAVLADAGPAAKAPPLLLLKALLAMRQGELPKAKDAVAAALHAAPDYPLALVLAGELDLRSGNLISAEQHLSNALRLQPTSNARRLLVATLMRQGRSSKALEMLLPLLQEDGANDAGLAMLAGEVYMARGDLRRAGEYFEASKAAGASESVARTRLGQLAITQGSLDKGVQELEAASALGPQLTEPDLLLVSIHFRRHDYAKALAAAKALIQKQPQNPLGHWLTGTAQALLRDRSAARGSFEAALKLKPDHVPALRALAELDMADGKAQQAQRRYEALLAKQKDNAELLVAMASLQERTGLGDQAAATLRKAVAAQPKAREPVVELVQFHLRRNEATAALAVAREATVHNPDDSSLALLLSTAQEATGASKDAVRTLNALVMKEPRAVAPLLRLAQIQVRQRHYDAATATLLRARENAPHNDAVAHALVAVHMQAGNVDQALKTARDIQDRQPQSTLGYLLEGDARAHAKKWSDAERAYRTALKIDPDSHAAAARILRVHQASGNKKQGEEFASGWIAHHPNDVAMRLLVADGALRSRNLPVAIRQYEAALAIKPNEPVVLNNLAWALGQLKDPRAIGLAEQAAALSPANADVLETLGTLYLQAGEIKKGLDALQQVRDLAPDRPDLRMRYAKGLLESGRKEEAKAELRELATARVDFPGKADIPALLAAP